MQLVRMNKVYWTTKTGEKIDIDEMDISHLRNTLKMIVRRAEEVKKDIIKRGLYNEYVRTHGSNFRLNGDIAQMSIDDEEYNEYYPES